MTADFGLGGRRNHSLIHNHSPLPCIVLFTNTSGILVMLLLPTPAGPVCQRGFDCNCCLIWGIYVYACIRRTPGGKRSTSGSSSRFLLTGLHACLLRDTVRIRRGVNPHQPKALTSYCLDNHGGAHDLLAPGSLTRATQRTAVRPHCPRVELWPWLLHVPRRV